MAEAQKPQPIRLEDYRPPDWLVDRVELDFALGETASEVTARLEVRRNPAAGRARRPWSWTGRSSSCWRSRSTASRPAPTATPGTTTI